MLRCGFLLLLLYSLPLTAQHHSWSSTVELGWNSGRDLGYGLRLNYAVPLGKDYTLVMRPLLERGVVETEMTSGTAFAFSGPLSPDFLPTITTFELRSGLGLGVRREIGSVRVGASVWSVWRLNKALDIDLPNQFTPDGLPRTTRSIRFGQQFNRSPEIADDLDWVITGDRLRLQAGLEAGVMLNTRLELSLAYRYDAFGKHEYQITGLGGFRPDPDTPLNLFNGVSRGHYLMLGLTVGW